MKSFKKLLPISFTFYIALLLILFSSNVAVAQKNVTFNNTKPDTSAVIILNPKGNITIKNEYTITKGKSNDNLDEDFVTKCNHFDAEIDIIINDVENLYDLYMEDKLTDLEFADTLANEYVEAIVIKMEFFDLSEDNNNFSDYVQFLDKFIALGDNMIIMKGIIIERQKTKIREILEQIKR